MQENFDRASSDLLLALEYKSKLPENYQERAEAHYKLALALEFKDSPTSREEALAQVLKAIECLNERISQVDSTQEAHVKEAKELIGDLQLKVVLRC